MLSDRATAMEEGDVRFGSKAEMQRNRSCPLYSRKRTRAAQTVPKSRHAQCTLSCLLRANSGHRALFDQFVSTV
jgi:hypothetical protein